MKVHTKDMAVCLIGVLNLIAFYICFCLSLSDGVRSNDNPEQKGTYFNRKDHVSNISLEANKQFFKQDDAQFNIYCYQNVPKSFLQIWRSVQLILEHVPLSCKLYCGENGTDVAEKREKDFFWNPSSWWSVQSNIVEFPAFSPYCVGIYTEEKYVFHLQVRVVNYWKFLQTLIGIMLFLSAPSLSRNSFFHYTSGVSIGVLASLLVLIYVISRFIPKKTASYVMLAFGYSFVLYVLKAVWHDLNKFIFDYMDYFLTYCVVTAFISFVICYRLGPVKNARTFNLIQWFMQVIGLLLIFFSSEYREITTALAIILLTAHFIPTRYVLKLQFIWYRFFPPKVKLLTEVEYLEQGRIETEKALENLRKYCSSPDCNVWKTVSRLKDPIRFANYIEKGNHFTDEELLDYNSEDFADTIESDDETETHLYMNGSYNS